MDASTLPSNHSPSRHDIANVFGTTKEQGSGEIKCVGEDKPGLVEGGAKSTPTEHCTLRIPLQPGSGGSKLPLQSITDDLAWFDHLVSVNSLGQVNLIPRLSGMSIYSSV